MGTQERERRLTERVGVLVRGVSIGEEGGRSAGRTLGRGKGLWAPGLVRGPAVDHAAPRPAKGPLLPVSTTSVPESLQVWGTSRPVTTAVSPGSWLPYSSAPSLQGHLPRLELLGALHS